MQNDSTDNEANSEGHNRPTPEQEPDFRGYRKKIWAIGNHSNRMAEISDQLESILASLIGHWWWRLGLRLRALTKAVGLKSRDPFFPHDNAQELFRELGTELSAVQKETSTCLEGSEASEEALNIEHPETLSNGKYFTGNELGVRVDIVVTVHNALDHVGLCLDSLARNIEDGVSIIIVDDASEAETCSYLSAFAKAHSYCSLIRNHSPKRYTNAANQGLHASSADFVILLNSDTIVSSNWIHALIECAQSNPALGIVGPLSNAAEFQSVPIRKDPTGKWAMNHLPPGISADDMATVIRKLSTRSFPTVPIVNGFCYMIKRSVIESIGYLDETLFPEGYGEEVDYCFRARDAGFELGIADHCYIYHAKSKSFGQERRKALIEQGNRAIRSRYGSDRMSISVRGWEENFELFECANRLQRVIDNDEFYKFL